MEDGNLLSTEQVLLLENLLYLSDTDPLINLKEIERQGKEQNVDNVTVEYIINLIDKDMNDNNDYGSYMTGEDWKNIIKAIKNDDTLLNMKLVETHGDPAKGKNEGENYKETGDGAISALFVNEETGEAVVAFRGTVGYEWGDNFYGGAPTEAKDGVSTEYQEKALAWYKSLDLSDYMTITVTGHSKGGNKAKYITLMDQSVDRCLSFDGQGFSDEFVEYYKDLISANQYKITNHNVDYDFVNLLLNDVGIKFYYHGYDYGKGTIAEAHCPNTFFEFDKNGNAKMYPTVDQAEEMQVVNKLLNSYIRSLNEEQRYRTMDLIGKLVEEVFSDKSEKDYVEIINNANGWDEITELVVYIGAYSDMHPEVEKAVEDVIFKFVLQENSVMVEKFRHLLKVIKYNMPERIVRSVIVNMLKADIGQDRQIMPTHWELTKTRVLDIPKLEIFGRTGKSLMDVGYLACTIWDDAVGTLKELYDSLDRNVKSLPLENSLSAVNDFFAREEYVIMGSRLQNTVSSLTKVISEADTEGAEALDEIIERLNADITMIKGLKECIDINPLFY